MYPFFFLQPQWLRFLILVLELGLWILVIFAKFWPPECVELAGHADPGRRILSPPSPHLEATAHFFSSPCIACMSLLFPGAVNWNLTTRSKV